MHEGVKELFNQVENKKNLDHPRLIVDEASDWDKGHGRIEERRIRVSHEVNWLKRGKKWSTVNSLIEVTATRTLASRSTTEKRYYLSDMRTEAKKFLKWIRCHWGVESFHWMLDVIPFARNKFINLKRRQHKFLCLERATIAEWQGASEGQKFVAKPTSSNMNLFLANGISRSEHLLRCTRPKRVAEREKRNDESWKS